MKKVVIGIILTVVSLVVIADTQDANRPDVFGQEAHETEVVNI
ncbi:NprX family peptide pheromone [Bacillus sp. FJAT-53711]|uniref:NprX family peptide pheromone n=1 Tax=Bacillus yunxiaonensis TaxID=3127665 RepID=A0ABU8G0Z5_9BACI